MPLRWEILHAEKLVYLVADGTVTLKDLEEHFDAVLVADAMPYAHLFNAINCQPVYSDADVMTMAARVRFTMVTVCWAISRAIGSRW